MGKLSFAVPASAVVDAVASASEADEKAEDLACKTSAAE